MSTQVAITEQIRQQKGEYVLAVKRNQTFVYEEIKMYLDDPSFEQEMKQKNKSYTKTIDSARSQIGTREYYQTDKIEWMQEKTRWKGLRTIGKVVTTSEKNGKKRQETRDYISSCTCDVEQFKKAARGHWGIESMHWHLDVTFREDANHTLNKNSARNLNIIRKMALPFLKSLEEPFLKYISLKKRRFWISMNFAYYLGVFYERYIAH